MNPESSNDKKTIVITGCSGGLGFSVFERLATREKNYHFVMAVHRPEEFHDVLRELSLSVSNIKHRVDTQQLELCSSESIKSFASWVKSAHGSIDGIIECAGYAAGMDEFNEEIALKSMQINFFGCVELLEALKPMMNNNGKIVVLGSSLGKIWQLKSDDLKKKLSDPNLNRSTLMEMAQNFVNSVKDGSYESKGFPKQAYAMSKLFLNEYMRILARDKEISSKGIQCYSCCPGYVKSNTTKGKGDRPISEGIECAIYLIDELPWKVDEKLQGQLFYDNKPTPLDSEVPWKSAGTA